MWLKDFFIIDEIKITFAKNFEHCERTKPLIIFVHGFLGAKEDWKNIFELLGTNVNAVALDLPGLGDSFVPYDAKFFVESFLIRLLKDFISHFPHEKKVVIGYSMGGRAALSFAVYHSQLLDKLILESCTAGLESDLEKKVRVESDDRLCRLIESEGIEKFLDHWDALPLFESQKKLSAQTLKDQKIIRQRNDPASIIYSLKNFGTGEMTSHWENLENIKCPVLLISGELDEKFFLLNRRMKKLIPNCEHEIVKDTGHNTHLEKPNEFVNLIRKFLTI